MKANEQYFPAVLFIMLYMVVLTASVHEILTHDHSNESYWAVLSCAITLKKDVFTFASVHEILKGDNSSCTFESTVCYALQGVPNFWVCIMYSKNVIIQKKAIILSST